MKHSTAKWAPSSASTQHCGYEWICRFYDL